MMEANVQPMTKLEKILHDSEFNRFGLITVILTIVGCLGGIAVGMGAINSVVTLTAVIVPTMLTLSLLLAVAPMRYIFIAASLSILIDISFIAYFAIAG